MALVLRVDAHPECQPQHVAAFRCWSLVHDLDSKALKTNGESRSSARDVICNRIKTMLSTSTLVYLGVGYLGLLKQGAAVRYSKHVPRLVEKPDPVTLAVTARHDAPVLHADDLAFEARAAPHLEETVMHNLPRVVVIGRIVCLSTCLHNTWLNSHCQKRSFHRILISWWHQRR